MSGKERGSFVGGKNFIGISLLGLAAALSACTSASDRLDSGAGSQSAPATSRFAQLFSGSTAQASAPAEKPTEEIDCPVMDVRVGASTLSAVAPGGDPSNMSLRYQGTIVNMARECALRGADMAIRAGTQGRIILGPAGGPGQINIPLRYALVREGPEPKTIWTKLYNVPVIIGEGQSFADFTHIEQDLVFTKPKPDEVAALVIYVGFDPLAAPEKTSKKKAAPSKR